MSGTKQYFEGQSRRFVRCRMNDDAILYHKNNAQQMRDAIICLEDNVEKMKWKDGSRIIDIGCGDGSVTNIIKKYIPKNFEKLIGCDINEKMVIFASEIYKNENTDFMVMDIEGPLPKELKGSFDHVFSFYTLHWIQNQEIAFTNILDLLSKEGDCFLSILGYMPIYTAYWAVAGTEKWRKWIPSCEGFMSPYHNSQEPEKHIANMLKTIGFQNVEVNCKQMKFTFTVESLKNTIKSINPFSIPKEIFDDFLDDYIIVFRDMRLMTNSNIDTQDLDSMTFVLPYNLIIVYASKS